MKIFVLLLCVSLNFKLGQTTGASVFCETIQSNTWYDTGSIKTCRMQTLKIASEGILISSSDVSIRGFTLGGNRQIFFLPSRIDNSFPNLLVIDAAHCSLKSVSKDSFVNLKKLQLLYLQNNQIDTIRSDTFKDLTSLEQLYLDQNQLIRMKGEALIGLSKLKDVALRDNICINERYQGSIEIKDINEINMKCGFSDVQDELSIKIEKISREKQALLDANVILQKKLADAESDNQKSRLVTLDYAKLQSDLEDARNQKELMHIAFERSMYNGCSCNRV